MTTFLSVIFYSSLIVIHVALDALKCDQLTIQTSLWGSSQVDGLYLAPYSYPLQFIGCIPFTSGSCEHFYCQDTTNGMEFGTNQTSQNNALRALIGDYSSYTQWPQSWIGCLVQSDETLLNAPVDNISANALCNQIGYVSGYVIVDDGNSCPEGIYDEEEGWMTDFVRSYGFGRRFVCEGTMSATTSMPTAQTTSPSSSPTYHNCEDGEDIIHLDWNSVIDDGGENIPTIQYNIMASSEDKLLAISVELDYLGYSYINNIPGFGTTYHLGFYSFDGSSIISNCDNRMTSSYINKTWTEYWQYSEYPFLNDSIGTTNFLAYPPPSQYWTIKMKNRCSKLQYSAEFSWEDLSQCKSDDNETLAVDVVINDEFINMSGIFFVDVYSPMSMESDTGHYYKYELLSYPFTISIQKSVNILSAINLFPFTTSIIFVGKNNDENILKVILLTESALGIPLTSPSLLVAPNNNQNKFNFTNDRSDCLSFRSNICSQIWEIEANIDCPFIFSGDYALQFNVIYNGSNSSDIISLSTPLVFEDSICNDSIWKITYDAQSTLYNDSTFLTSIANDNEFIIGQDRVYVEIVIDDIDDAEYFVLDAKLLNVWLCSSTNNGELVLNQNNLTSSGCFSSVIDADGPYHIIVNYNESFTNGARHEDDTFNNIVRFSFIVPDTIASDALYIQVQLGLEFTGRNNRRRTLLSDHKEQANQMFHHFVGLHVLTPSESPNIIHTTDSSNDGDNVNPEVSHVIIVKEEGNDNSWMSVVMILMGIFMLIFVIVGIGCFVRYKRKSAMNKGYVYGQGTAEAVRVDSNQTECVSMDGRAGNIDTNEENDLL